MLTILRDTIAPSAVRMSDQRSVIWPMRCVCYQARPPRRYRNDRQLIDSEWKKQEKGGLYTHGADERNGAMDFSSRPGQCCATAWQK